MPLPSSPAGERLLAEIDLTGCPVGTVLDPNEPDQRIEQRHFQGWRNSLNDIARWHMPSCYRVVQDGGREALEHINKTDRCLVAGEPLWADYTVEAHIRQLNAYTQPNMDDPHGLIARSGLMLRYQDLRRYYYFCLEAHTRFAFYRREDEAWTLLAEVQTGIDRARYYHLKAVCEGERIAGYIDGRLAFVVYDAAFPTGKVGLRTNTRSRMYGVRVTATEAAQAAYVSRLNAYEREVAEAAEPYPKPALWKRIDLGAWWPCTVRYGDFRGAGRKEILLEQTTADGPRVVALDFDGQVQWDRTYPAAAPLQRTILHDLDGDGAEEFIGIAGERLCMVSGRTGEPVAETSLPTTGPYRGYRNVSMGGYLHSLRVLWPCRLRRTARPQDLILRDGDGAGTGYSIWAFDEKLTLRWRQDAHNAWYGMYLWFYDVDGDGRDEVLPGYDLYDGDGNHLWTMEGAEYIEDSGGAGHIDHAAFGELDGDERNGPEIGIAGSDPGFFLVDARTGALRRHHRFGHVQGIYAGNFRPDLPGLEMWMGNRWGNYGILNLVSGQGDPLCRCEPDNRSQGGPAVNWRGDGEELLFLSSSREAFGLYDARGRNLIRPVCDGVPPDCLGGIVEDVAGDARDEITYVHDGALYIVTQDAPYPSGARIYAPTRRFDISLPGWKINEIGSRK
jgi:hypothetical protein